MKPSKNIGSTEPPEYGWTASDVWLAHVNGSKSAIRKVLVGEKAQHDAATEYVQMEKQKKLTLIELAKKKEAKQ